MSRRVFHVLGVGGLWACFMPPPHPAEGLAPAGSLKRPICPCNYGTQPYTHTRAHAHAHHTHTCTSPPPSPLLPLRPLPWPCSGPELPRRGLYVPAGRRLPGQGGGHQDPHPPQHGGGAAQDAGLQHRNLQLLAGRCHCGIVRAGTLGEPYHCVGAALVRAWTCSMCCGSRPNRPTVCGNRRRWGCARLEHTAQHKHPPTAVPEHHHQPAPLLAALPTLPPPLPPPPPVCPQVLNTEPGNVKALFRRARAHHSLGRTAEALQDLEAASKGWGGGAGRAGRGRKGEGRGREGKGGCDRAAEDHRAAAATGGTRGEELGQGQGQRAFRVSHVSGHACAAMRAEQLCWAGTTHVCMQPTPNLPRPVHAVHGGTTAP